MVMQGRAAGREEDGFGLIDAMISLAVLLVILTATSYLVDNVVQQAASSREKVAATELAEQWLEQISNAPISSLQGYISRDVQLTSTPVPVGNVNYTVWGHLEWADTGATQSLCASGNPPQVIRATITVKWNNGQSAGETSVINPPYGTVIPGDGFLSIQIQGRNPPSPPSDKPNLTNVGVTVTPPSPGSPVTYSPDQFGCVYLQEPTGTYGVSLSSPSGGPTFIDNQENLSPSQPSNAGVIPVQPAINVAVAGLAYPATFHYDEAGTVTFSPSAAAPAAGGMPISVSNGGNLQNGSTYIAVPAGATATSAPLFPYSTSYSVWYGDCKKVGSQPIVEQPATPATVSVSPQGTSSVAITGLQVVSLAVTQTGAGASAPTAKVTVADPNAATDGCTSSNGEVYTLAGMTGSGTSYSDQTALLPQTYTLTVKDPNNNQTVSGTLVVNASGTITYNGTPEAGAIPVTVP